MRRLERAAVNAKADRSENHQRKDHQKNPRRPTHPAFTAVSVHGGISPETVPRRKPVGRRQFAL